MFWKVVHIQWPEAINYLVIDSGYAVASSKSYYSPIVGEVISLVVLRYSGYELPHHALTHCNNLNIWQMDTEDRRIWPLLEVNRNFVYDAV